MVSSGKCHTVSANCNRPQKDGRYCGDYKVTINPALDVDHYPLPNPSDLYTSLTGGQRFTLSQAYQQLLLDEASKEPTTITTARIVPVSTLAILYCLLVEKCSGKDKQPDSSGDSSRAV